MIDRLRYIAHQLGRIFDRKKTKAWSGLSILVFRDDHADHPYRIRINYYLIFFLLFTLGILMPAGFYLLIERSLASEKTTYILENRRALMHSIMLLSNNNLELVENIHDQIRSIEKSSSSNGYPDLIERLPDLVRRQHFTTGNTPVDTITRNLKEIQDVRLTSTWILKDQAYYSLKPIWNRMKVHHIMPRGRPLPSGIGYITSTFGLRRNPFNPGSRRLGDFHSGVDLASAPGTPIVATAPGTVTKVVNATVSGYGLYVKIHHELGYSTLYSHNSRNLVREGQRVERGQVIARMGATGAATGNHVHYEVIYGASLPIDPMEYLQIQD